MKLKSLKLALRVFDVCLKKHKYLIDCVKDDEDYNMGMEAYKDIESCIKDIEKQIKELEKECAETEGTGWAFPATINVEYDIKHLKNVKGIK